MKIKIDDSEFWFINKDNFENILNGKYDIDKNNMAFGDFGEDKEIALKVINVIFTRKCSIYLRHFCLLKEFNFEMDIFQKSLSETTVTESTEKPSIETIIPDSVQYIYFMDGFSKPIIKGILPKVRFGLNIYFGNVGENVLQIDSIPNNVRSTLHLMDGFNQTLNKRMIPENIEKIYFGNIGENVLKPTINEQKEVENENDIQGSLPNTIKEYYFLDGFNQPLVKGIIPIKNSEKIRLHFGNIGENVLKQGSIPDVILAISLMDGFNQPLEKHLISSVSWFYLFNIGENVLKNDDQCSLPNKIKELTLENGFNQPLPKGTIPETLPKLYIYNIGEKVLQQGSIPGTIEQLHFWKEFNQPLPTGVISEGIEWVETSTKQFVLQHGSLPNSVKTIYLRGLTNKITPGVISEGVKDLNLIDFKVDVLEIGSLPETLEKLYLSSDSGQKHFVKGIIPFGIEKLKLNGKFELFEEKQISKMSSINFVYPFFSNIVSNIFIVINHFFGGKKSTENTIETPKPGVFEIGSIPDSVRELELTSFDHPIKIGVIPDSVEKMYTYDIGKNVFTEEGSIPKTVKEIELGSSKDKFLLKSNLLPNNIKIIK